MRIRYFIPIALAVLVLFAMGAEKTGFVPVVPIVAITLAGAILILFQLEDHRVGRFLAELSHAFHEAAHLHK